MDKIRRFWFPFSILAIVVLTIGWILAGVVYPNTVQGNALEPRIENTPTSTATPTESPTSTISAQPTATSTILPPTETPSGNCTYSIYFWGTNENAWRIENIVIGNLSYTKAEAIEILTKTQPTPTERLMGQFFTALLNSLNGADSTDIDSTMIAVRDWLILNPHGIDLSESELLEIETYTVQLEDYNRGVTGPGLCSDEPATPTAVPTDTPTLTATSTQGTFIPFFTPTPTKGNGGRPNPTNPPLPTNTPQPQPTNTPFPSPTSVIPPTDAPTSPPPTKPPTQPPPPTATQQPLPTTPPAP